MSASQSPAIDFVSPEQLVAHPDLADFPSLSDDQLAALTISIKERGIQTPLVVDDERQVFDGRARLGIALALDLPSVPVIYRAEKDVLAFAIESAVNRRQLTRSAIAFLLFEQHPDLASASNKGGRPKKLAGVRPVSGLDLASFRDLAVRYRVVREHFTLLAEMRAEMTPDEWTALRSVVLFEEASISRQFAGFKTGRPAGSARGPVVYASVSEQGLLEGILPRAFASIREGFSRWSTEIDSKGKAAVEKEWADLLDQAPPELLRIAKRKAAQQEGRA
jgi:hypothetical protein